ncbi:kinase-like domain-containing protein [Lipomyces japonicus]|uniref:kinase-like domain-containing protein n=1 Tax=Lipomyces japonicus TaxID=56871 RepID=UPI0034CE1F7F
MIMSHNGNKADIQNAKAKLVESYNQILEEFSTGGELKNVGNYSVSRLIGKGSFGKVFLATHKLTGTKVVLKSAQKSDLNLAREIHHYRNLLHPHVARLYEVIVTESLVWLALEYCPGDELYTFLINKGKLSIEQAQQIFSQISGAVAYIHMKNIVHRDLKLENILLDKRQSAKLCDFGFTRECEPKRLLQTFCGTICYAAPEMVKGEKYHGQAVDVWSLGIILYALLCGELPFDEEDEVQTRMRISNDEPEYPTYLPDEALSLLKSMLSKRPSARPSAVDILQHPFLAGHSSPQLSLLMVPDPVPFTTRLERDLLDRLRHAYIDIDALKESVINQKCDNLSGWWVLALEREQYYSKKSRRKRRAEKYKKLAESSLSKKHSEPVVHKSLAKEQVGENKTRLNTAEGKSAENLKTGLANQPSTKNGVSLSSVFGSLKGWPFLKSRNKQLALTSSDEATMGSKRSSIKSFLMLNGTSNKLRIAASGQSNNTGEKSETSNAISSTNGDSAADASATRIISDQLKLNGVEENLELQSDDVTAELKDNLPQRGVKKIAIPHQSAGLYSTDSIYSTSRDRHSSPGSAYLPRIGRNSTSSSVSSLRSSSKPRPTLSRASSTSSNMSVSSHNTSTRSPRTSFKYLPSTPKIDRFDRSWTTSRGRQIFNRRSSFDEDSISISGSSTTSRNRPIIAENSNSDLRYNIAPSSRTSKISRTKNGYHDDAAFVGPNSPFVAYSKRRRIPFAFERGRKGSPNSRAVNDLPLVDGIRSRGKGKSLLLANDSEPPIEEVDEPGTVDEDAEFSDDEEESRRHSLL